MSIKMNAIIVDLDGTLIDNAHKYYECISHKNEFDFRKFMENTIDDKPCEGILEIVNSLWYSPKAVIFLTARHEDYRDVTIKWLNTHIQHEKISHYNLYMRNEDENVPDSDSKRKNLFKILEDYNVLLAIDDRQENIEMFRSLGIKTMWVQEPH